METRIGGIDWFGRAVATVAAVAVGVAAFLIAQPTPVPLPPVMSHAPYVRLDPQEFGSMAIARLVLSNNGGSDLVVDRFQTSCSCAGVEIERDGKLQRISDLRVPARSQAEVVVRIGVGARPGTSQPVQVTFASNDPAHPVSTFDVQIPRVLGGVYAVPAAAIFGDVAQRSADAQTVYIYDNGVKSRRIGNIGISHPERFEVELLTPQPGTHEPQVHETAGQMIAVAKIRPKPGWVGPLDGYFELSVLGEARPPDRVDVIGQVIGPFECRPDVLSLPRFVAGKPEYRCEFQITRRDGKQIASVTPDELPKEVTVIITPDPTDPTRVKVLVSCDPTGPGPSRTVRLRFRAQAGQDGAALIEVPLLVTGKPL
jgi:hypothetical protein